MRNIFQGVEDYDMDDADEGANNKDGNGSDESESEGSADRGLLTNLHIFTPLRKSPRPLKITKFWNGRYNGLREQTALSNADEFWRRSAPKSGLGSHGIWHDVG